MVRRLLQDHADMQTRWASARPVLERIARPPAEDRASSQTRWQPLAASEEAALDSFASLYASHIEAENQLIYPAAEISEQISTAGKEASGTSNMKLMMNGAITLGTLDGANIEIADLAGRENEAIFGLTAPEVEQLWASNSYFAWDTLNGDRERLGRVMDELKDNTFAGLSGNFESIYNELMNNNDPDLVMADFRSYVDAWEKLTGSYGDQETWNRKALLNTASSGWFSSDRTIREYRDEIWHA